ncbi:MAG: GNAT family N-acetyltransferase [Rhodothermales bacterium]|nr:GNAT family N-acetyltransferase [Rhodothermales bacterium]
MPEDFDYRITRLGSADSDSLLRMMGMFGDVFDEVELYTARRPGTAYLEKLLADDSVIALAAEHSGEIVGGVVAYEFRKLEREISEWYIYDLAVVEACRRRGIATALIGEVGRIASAKGADVMFIQADSGNAEAVSLYSHLGRHERIHNFEIDLKRDDDRRD